MEHNHRLLAHEINGKTHFQIHEVHYDGGGNPHSYTPHPMCVEGSNVFDVDLILNKMKACVKKPILYAGDKFPSEYDSGSFSSE